MSWGDFWGGVRDRIDAPARALSLITVTHDPSGVPHFSPHVPFTEGGARDPQTGTISDGRTAHQTIYPIAAQLSLVTPTTGPDGQRRFDLHVPFTPGGSLDPKTGAISDGQTAAQTAQKVEHFTTETIRDTTHAVIDPVKDATKDLGGDLLKGLVPIAIVAGLAFVAAKAVESRGAKN